MDIWCTVCLLCFQGVVSLKTPPTEDYYMAAVVEYHPYQGNDTLTTNANNYIQLIEKAAESADIVVFPEGALWSGAKPVTFEVPFTNTTVTNSENLDGELKRISEAARNYSIYTAVNIREKEIKGNETLMYNTNVIFDRNGTVIGRYRKYNLFNERITLNITDSPEHIYFDTDFGVRFGTMTCFDILFKEPTLMLKNYNVTDFIFPTWWFSELPQLTAIQEQAAWSYRSDSNLLASGTNYISRGSSGTGIYAGRRGPVVYIQSTKDQTALLIAKLYKSGRNGTSEGKIEHVESFEAEGDGRLNIITEDLPNYEMSILTPTLSDEIITSFNNTSSKFNYTRDEIIEKQICQNKFCCNFYVNISVVYTNENLNVSSNGDNFNRYLYTFAVLDGVRSFTGVTTGGLQSCGIFPCLNDSLSSCGRTTYDAPPISKLPYATQNIFLKSTSFNSVIIKTSGLDKESFAEPSILEGSINNGTFGSLMAPGRFHFSQEGTVSELRFSSDKLGSASIFARVFSRDGSDVGINSSSPSIVVSGSLIICVMLFKFL